MIKKRILPVLLTIFLVAALSLTLISGSLIQVDAAFDVAVNIPATVTVSGTVPPSERFTVTLKPENNKNPMPSGSAAGTKQVILAANTSARFGEMHFTQLGTYYYTIYQSAGSNPSLQYDGTIYRLTVFVSWQGDEIVCNAWLLKDDDIKHDVALFENSVKEDPSEPPSEPSSETASGTSSSEQTSSEESNPTSVPEESSTAEESSREPSSAEESSSHDSSSEEESSSAEESSSNSSESESSVPVTSETEESTSEESGEYSTESGTPESSEESIDYSIDYTNAESIPDSSAPVLSEDTSKPVTGDSAVNIVYMMIIAVCLFVGIPLILRIRNDKKDKEA